MSTEGTGKGWSVSRKLWVICLAIWLILWGLLVISNVRFDGQNLIQGVLAIAAAIFLLLEM